MSDAVTYQQDGRIVTLTLNEPETRNAISPAIIKAIVAHFGNDPQWKTVRPPLTELTAAHEAQVITDLKAAGFTMPGL